MPPPFSATVMDHFQHPRHVGRLEPPCGEGRAASTTRGIDIRIAVRIVGTCVSEARFLTYGCVPAIASASLICERIKGGTVAEAQALTPEAVIAALGGLPASRHICAELAIDAMRAALQSAAARNGETA